MKVKAKVLSSFFLFCTAVLFGQGSLMLAGGGGESQGGWSDKPYAWVVKQAANKRIAIISYSSQSEWLPDYFKSFGAARAKNFYIPDRITANKQETYDSLISYDGIFFKGGDQFVYYDRYSSTKTQEAVQKVFDNGGVLSGTSAGLAILSPIVFTAEVASVDPSQALLNAYSSQITLEDDFLSTLDEQIIFDSHFAERGRFGRLPGFMAKWFRKTGEIAKGIGVDDHTAICIDKNKLAIVYGTGAVSFLSNMDENNPYGTNTDMLRAQNMQIRQLLHECTIDLNNGEISGLEESIDPELSEENYRYSIYFSGTLFPSDTALNYFVNLAGTSTDAIVIVSGMNLSRADDLKSKMESFGASKVSIVQALSGKRYDAAAGNAISEADKIVVVDNSYDGFMSFVDGGGNGSMLNNKLREEGMISFFVGDNARFAGRTVVFNYLAPGFPSYNGLLELKKGMALLGSTAILPNAFISTDYYENTVTGLPFAMIMDALSYGIYVTGNTFGNYSFDDNNTSFFKSVTGTSPLIVLQNKGTLGGFANQGPNESSRNIAGFESMNLKFLAPGDTALTGLNVPDEIHNSLKGIDINVFPNPAAETLNIEAAEGLYRFQISDISGRVLTENRFTESFQIDVSDFAAGIYLISVHSESFNSGSVFKCLITSK